MEIDTIQKKRPKISEEETQDTSMVIPTRESTTPSVSYFKIPSFLLKTFQKRFDYCNNDIDEKGISSEIEKKKWLIEVASTFYKIFGGGKFSACRMGSKIDGEDEVSSSESEATEEDYRDEQEKIFVRESIDGSETQKKFRKDEKISSQTKLPISILHIFSKKNAIDFNLSFSFIKSRICKNKNGNRNRNRNRNLDNHKNLRENESVTRLKNPERLLQKQMMKNSTAMSYQEDDENGEQLWQKRILMGERCKPLTNTSVSLLYDRYGMILP